MTTPPMSLAEAWMRLDGERDDEWRAAAKVVYAALQDIAQRLRAGSFGKLSNSDKDDIVSQKMASWLSAAPARRREYDDSRVIGTMTKSLEFAARDRNRKGKTTRDGVVRGRFVYLPTQGELDTFWNTRTQEDDCADDGSTSASFSELRSRFQELFEPLLTLANVQARDSIRETYDMRCKVLEGTTTFDAQIRGRLIDETQSERTMRNRYHKKHQRAVQTLQDGLRNMAQAGAISPDELPLLLRFVQTLFSVDVF